MQDYEQYREHVDISSMMMVKALRPHFRGFSKSLMANVNHPEKYGVCLTPEAEDILIGDFGSGPGLAHRKYPRKRRENRAKKNQVTVRLTDDLYLRLLSLDNTFYPTMQSLIEGALEYFVEEQTGK